MTAALHPITGTRATEGPWKACRGGKCSCGLIWGADGETHVARAISGRDAGQEWHASDIIISDAEHQANARLIASAPSLRDALDALLFVAEANFSETDDIAQSALTAARSALLRAQAVETGEGRSHE